MADLPTYVYPFAFALLAFVGGRFLLGRAHGDTDSLPGWVLYGVAIACLAMGLVTVWMDPRY